MSIIYYVDPLAFLEFRGGAEVNIKRVYEHLKNKDNIILLPTISSLIENKEKIMENIDKIKKLNIPDFTEKIIENKEINYKDLFEKYIEYLKNEDSQIIFDQYFYVRRKISKIKLVKYLIYNGCNEEFCFESFCLSKKSNKKLVTLFQTVSRQLSSSLNYIYHAIKYGLDEKIWGLENPIYYRYILKIGKLLKEENYKYFLAVSYGTVESLGIKGEKVKVLKYGNAFDKKLFNYRTKNKEDYIVFYARLYGRKGLYDIPYIMRELKKYDKNIKLKIFGKFASEKHKDSFFNLVKKFNLEDNIEYLGFLSEEEKYKVVSKARVLLYPTHHDEFSLVILESLALGTPVVSYNIPGPYYVYKDLPSVKFVREFDIKSMAKEVYNILNMDDNEYFELIYNEKTDKFLEEHSSWEKVAEEIYYYLKN
jgi:glycosyltransferase involved in cell wall biosynthesis